MDNKYQIDDTMPIKVKELVAKKLDEHEAPLFVYSGWCKRCGICIAFCPQKALEWGKDGVPAVNAEKCVKCSMCEYRCPEAAITILQTRK